MNLILSIADYYSSFSFIYIGLNIWPEFGVNCLNMIGEVSEFLW